MQRVEADFRADAGSVSLMFVTFSLLGLMFGVWQVALAELQVALAAGGMLLALATLNPLLVLLGLLTTGLALSGIVPTAFSLMGDLAPQRTGEATSLLTTLGYGGFLLGPILIGWLADAFGLRLALSVIVVVGLLILALGGAVRAGSGQEE